MTAIGSIVDGNGGGTYNTDTTGEITAKAVTVTANTDTKVYDGNTSSPATPTVVGLAGADTGSFTQTYDNQNAGIGKTMTAAGTIADGNGGANYTVTYNTNTTGVITPRNLVVTADADQQKAVGTADPLPFTYTVGGLGLVSGDVLTGVLSRLAGEGVGNYTINQGSLDAGANYKITYIGNLFTISSEVNADTVDTLFPRNTAGLNGLLDVTDKPQQFLSILDVGAKVGDDNNVDTCGSDADEKANNPNTKLMFNFGVRLPQGVKRTCIF